MDINKIEKSLFCFKKNTMNYLKITIICSINDEQINL